MSSDQKLADLDNMILTSILITKLSPGIHTNIINSTNEEDAKLIWKSIVKHFLSSQPANWARV